MSLADQRRFLISLSAVEKSQPGFVFVCDMIRFESETRVTIALGAEGTAVTFPLTATAEEVWAGLTARGHGSLVSPQRSALEGYPSSTSPASVWAELHFDLGRTSYLEDIDDTVRYRSLTIVNDQAVIALTSATHPHPAQARIPLSTGEMPIHAADELAEALRTLTRDR